MRILCILSTVAVLAAPATMAVLAAPVMAETAQATISVTGEGQVEVAPDMATVTLGVSTDGDTAKTALGANNDAVAVVLNRLKEAGIADLDIQTSGLSLGPRFDYSKTNPDGTQPITGYVATNMVTVRVRKLDSVGSVLDAVVQDGANTLNGITFGLQDAGVPTDQARKAAIADARRKAELYAAAAGVKLGRVVSIGEQGGFVPPMPMADAALKAGTVPVAAGSLNVSASVVVVYELTQ